MKNEQLCLTKPVLSKVEGNGRPGLALRQAQDAALGPTLRQLERRFGAGVVLRLGDAPELAVRAISTGIPALDAALGVGGLPCGRVSDIYGLEASGKSTVCLKVMAEAQRQGGQAVLIDTEHALDPGYAARCGVNLAEMIVAQPQCAEEALEIAEAVVRAGAAVVVIDSAAALVPRAEVEGEMGDQFGHHGALMSQALRKLAGPVARAGTVLIFTNQMRVRSNALFAGPEVPTGGRALRFYAAVRLELSRVGTRKGQAVRLRATVRKNKVGRPGGVAEFDLREVLQ